MEQDNFYRNASFGVKSKNAGFPDPLDSFQSVQIIQIPINHLKSFLEDIKKELSDIKEQFQPKEPVIYLTRNELKDLLKVDLSTIYHWTKKGKLKAYSIGHRVYYKRHEVEQILLPLNS